MGRTQRSYDDQTKAAVMAALLEGQSVSKVADAYSVPKRTVSNWRKAVIRQTGTNCTQKGDGGRLEDLLLAYVQENLVTLREQAKHFRNLIWLEKQDASSVAVLHGVIADKAIRLLEVFGGSPDPALLDGSENEPTPS